MDRVTKKVRSMIMSRIRGKDTLPERIMWALMKEMDTPPERWACLPGKPDFVFEDVGIVVFIDGCFFHRCPRHLSNPKTNRLFWQKKFKANVERDRKVDGMLVENGWDVMRFWECDVKWDPDDVLYQIETMIEDKAKDLRDVRRQDRF